MNAQMTTIETVTVVRPLKVISLVCMIVSLFLLILSLFTTYWLKTHSFHTGLLEECVDNVSGAGLQPLKFGPPPGKCQPRSKHSTFTNIIFALMCVGCIARILGIIMNIMALRSNDLHKKFVFFKSATYLTFLTVITEVISLVGFPIIFFYTMNEYGVRYWEFDWSYGVAFSATLIELGALLLLICDKEHEEVYHKEKTIYNPPPDFA